MLEQWYRVNLPLKVTLPSKKKYILNLNVYRNTHHMTLAKAKVAFTEQVTPLLKHIPPLGKVQFVYNFYPRTKALSDVANVCCVVDKFFSDTAKHAGVIPDDNYTILPEVIYRFGAVDKLNPRVEVHIIPIP